MGGTIAVGVLMPDGNIYYYLVRDISAYDVMNTSIEEHKKFAEYAVENDTEFFSAQSFEEDDSAIRYLVVDASTIRYRYHGDKDEYTLTKKKT